MVARLQLLLGEKVVADVPLTMPFWTAQAMKRASRPAMSLKFAVVCAAGLTKTYVVEKP